MFGEGMVAHSDIAAAPTDIELFTGTCTSAPSATNRGIMLVL